MLRRCGRVYGRTRVCAQPGSRIPPRDRRWRETACVPPPELLPPEELPPPDAVGIKRAFDATDVGTDAANLTFIPGPLPGEFRHFAFHEDVDAYVAQNDDGELNLRECYFYDRAARVYAIPDIAPEVAGDFRPYQVLEWDTWISGEAFEDVEEQFQLHRVYFVQKTPIPKGRHFPEVDFHQVFCLDGAKRTFHKPLVQDLRDEKTVDPVLCIKEGELVIQDTRDCPTMEGYARAYYLKKYLEAQLTAMEEGLEFDEELLEESEELEGLEERPDAPDADLI